MTIKSRIGGWFMLNGLLICSLTASAWGQTEPIILEISDLTPINADNCESSLSQQMTFQVQHTDSSSLQHTMRVVFFSESKDCLSNVSGCPENHLGESEVCGCIDEFSVNSDSMPITTNTILGSDSELVDFLCASSQTLTFSVSVLLDDEGSEPVYTQNPLNLSIDVDAPAAPTVAPSLGSGEQSLTVSLADRDELSDDVTRHQICFAPAGSIVPPNDCSLMDDLTKEERNLRLYCGFSASDCRETNDLLDGDYRLEGLMNEVEYEVVVAALDAAGNRSENSPSSIAKPADFIDFAEGYGQVFGDGSIGETGGCTVSQHSPILWMGFLIGIMSLRRVRW